MATTTATPTTAAAAIDDDDDDDAQQQQQLVQVIQEWKQRFATPGTNPMVLDLPVAEVCAQEQLVNHHGKTKAVCQVLGYPGVALLIRYHGVAKRKQRGSSLGVINGSEHGVYKELRTLNRLRNLGLPVVPFANELLRFNCKQKNPRSYHPYITRSLKQNLREAKDEPCAGYVAAYVCGRYMSFLNVDNFYNHLFVKHNDGNKTSSVPSAKGCANRRVRRAICYMRAFEPSSRTRLTDTLRRIAFVCKGAGIGVVDLQGFINVNTGEFTMIDASDTDLRKVPTFYAYIEHLTDWIDAGCVGCEEEAVKVKKVLVGDDDDAQQQQQHYCS